MGKETVQELALLLVKEKSEKALEKVYKRLKPGLLKYSGGILRDQDGAEDVVAEAFVKVWNRLEQYNPYWNFSTWVYKIVYHETLLYMRKSNRKNYYSFEDMTPSQIQKHTESDSLPGNEIQEMEMEFEKLLNKVEEEIYSLPDDYRGLMIDREIRHKQYREIEEIHSMKKNTVKTKIRRARIIIRKNLQKKYPELVEAYENF